MRHYTLVGAYCSVCSFALTIFTSSPCKTPYFPLIIRIWVITDENFWKLFCLDLLTWTPCFDSTLIPFYVLGSPIIPSLGSLLKFGFSFKMQVLWSETRGDRVWTHVHANIGFLPLSPNASWGPKKRDTRIWVRILYKQDFLLSAQTWVKMWVICVFNVTSHVSAAWVKIWARFC